MNQNPSSSPSLKIVVVGGSGLIGRPLVGTLRDRGHTVVVASPSHGINTVTGAGVTTALTGAHTVQLVSVLLKHGPHVVATLRSGLEAWMREHGYADLDQFRGLLNHQRCRDSAAFERANYIRVLQSWKV